MILFKVKVVGFILATILWSMGSFLEWDVVRRNLRGVLEMRRRIQILLILNPCNFAKLVRNIPNSDETIAIHGLNSLIQSGSFVSVLISELSFLKKMPKKISYNEWVLQGEPKMEWNKNAFQ